MFEITPFTLLLVTAIPLRRIDPVLFTSPVTVALEMLIQSTGAELLCPLTVPVRLIWQAFAVSEKHAAKIIAAAKTRDKRRRCPALQLADGL